ncbi:MAG TPA: tetratricopeptide repeat protein [Bradyrhizobium sp.]|nr:tetratricopeptide repeat protein [Bradyrhizobium sp.]
MMHTEIAIANLMKSAHDGKLVAVIGTGVSIALTNGKNAALAWKGLVANGFAYGVTKGKITPEQRQAWQAQLNSNDLADLLSAAEFVGHKLESPNGDLYTRWLESVFKDVVPENKAMSDAILALQELGIPICTLNYDSLLERVTGLVSINMEEIVKVAAWMRRENRDILHLHGSWDEPTTCILGIRDYNTTLNSDVRDLVQRNLGSFSRLLFIGCGDTFADPNFSGLIKWLREKMKGAAPQHYALVTTDDEPRRHADPSWHGFVEPISYGIDRQKLPAFLLTLFSTMKAEARRSANASSALRHIGATNSNRAKPVVLPYPSIGGLFKGRAKFLRGLNESLKRGGHAAIVCYALHGLGGIGKTRAAVEYAWEHQDEYNALLFVVADTPEALRRNLAALASVLMPKLDTNDNSARLQAVVDWLKTNPGWYLILDNVDTKLALAEVERFLGALSGGHVVVTSRLANFSGNFQPLELDVLAIDDATAFLLARTEGRRRATADDEAKARAVARELGQLALALEQAAALTAKRRLTFGQYLERLRSRGDEVLAWFDETVTGYPRAIAVAWQTSVAQLSKDGQRLLERLAWLAPEKIPELLLDVPIPGSEAESSRDALDDIAAYSLVTRDAEGPYFLIHRLVQDVTRRSLSAQTAHDRVNETLGWIDVIFDGDSTDVRNWEVLEPLVPHARAIVEYAAKIEILKPTSKLMNQIGIFLQARALPHEAEPLFRRALALDEQRLGADHPHVAIDLITIADLLRLTNQPVEAESLIRRAIAIDERHFGPDHPEVATDLFALARRLMDSNRMSEAEPLVRRALSIREKHFGPHHPAVAIGVNNLAQLLRTIGQLAEVEPLMRRAIAIDEGVYGPNHPNVGRHLGNLGAFFQETGRFAEAESLKRNALEIDEKNYGSLHPNVAVRLNALAILLAATDRISEAEPLARRAAAIFIQFGKRTGHSHEHMETVLNNYASVLEVMGHGIAEIRAAIDTLKREALP